MVNNINNNNNNELFDFVQNPEEIDSNEGGVIIINKIKEDFKDESDNGSDILIEKYKTIDERTGFFEKWFGISRDDELFKEKIGIFIFIIFLIFPSTNMSMFEPTIYQRYVEHHYPTYNKDQIASKASHLKSIADALPFISSFLSGPIIGIISDRIGRKKVLYFLITCAIIDIVNTIICYSQYWLWPLYITHFIAGFSTASDPIIFAYIADISNREERTKLCTLIGTTLGITVLISPLIGLGLLQIDPIMIAYVATGSFIIALIILYFLRESFDYCDGVPISRERRLANMRSTKSLATSNPFKSIYNLFKTSKYIGCYAILYFLFSFSVQDSSTTLYMYSNVRYDWNLNQVSYLSSAMGGTVFMWSILVSVFLLKYMSDRFIVCIAFLVSSIFHILYAFSASQYMFSVCICLGSFSLILINILQSIISKATPGTMQASILTGVNVLSSLSSFIGALSSENIFAYFISNSSPVYFPGCHFVIDAGIIFLTFLFSVYVLKKVNPPTNIDSEDSSISLEDGSNKLSYQKVDTNIN